MTKRSLTVTLLILFTATLILPASGFARQAKQQGDKADAKASSPQADQCSLRVEITAPKTKKDVSTNEVSCNKVTWGPTTTASGALTKKECLDERARIGKVKMQKKNDQVTKTCVVQQFARADLSASRTQQSQPAQPNQQNPPNRSNQQNQNQNQQK